MYHDSSNSCLYNFRIATLLKCSSSPALEAASEVLYVVVTGIYVKCARLDKCTYSLATDRYSGDAFDRVPLCVLVSNDGHCFCLSGFWDYDWDYKQII